MTEQIIPQQESAGQSTAQNKSLLYIEILRLLAIFLVLFNHTGTNGFFLFSVSQQSPLYWGYLLLSIFDKIAVPLFFMISGALLLGKEESLGRLYKKRVLRFAVLLVGISAFYYMYIYKLTPRQFSVRDFVHALYSENMIAPLWYLYAYLGILVMLPLLRCMARHMPAQLYVYLAVWHIFMVGLRPVAEEWLLHDSYRLNSWFQVPLLVSPTIFFLLMGYFFEKVLDESWYTARFTGIMVVLGAGFLCLAALLTHRRAMLMGECNEIVSQKYHDCLIAMPAMAVFFLCKFVCSRVRIGPVWQKLIVTLGGTTFGIYLLEKVLCDKTEWLLEALKPRLHILPACLVWLLVVCMLGAAVTLVLKKIPVIRKFL